MLSTDAFNYVNVLDKAADASWSRENILTNNIANVNTPGYKRKDLNFENTLKTELGRCKHESLDSKMKDVDLSRLNPSITRIVFVLTINDAFSKRLNFGMIEDAYVRILDAASDRELVSFVMDEYYSNVISMMIGEVYLHNGNWKFNAIGNGVAKDLEGLCGLYGVQVKQT